MSAKVKLTYLYRHVTNDLCRLIMAAGDIQYEEVKVEGEEWQKLKPKTPFGGLPILEYQGQVLAQSMTIARFLARLANLNGESKLEEAQTDMVVDHMQDLWNKVYSVVYPKSQDDEQKQGQELFDTVMPHILSTAETLLRGRGGNYFVGDKLSWADLAVTLTLDNLMSKSSFATRVPSQDKRFEIPKVYPLLHQLRVRVHQVGNIKTYLATRPEPVF